MIRFQKTVKSSQQLGRLGEKTATGFLIEKGYRILQKNYRCKIGEIDIIAVQNEYIVFVEVKSRFLGKDRINPLISVTKAKQKRIRTIGSLYLAQNNIIHQQPRFDVIAITFESNTRYSLEHIENAF